MSCGRISNEIIQNDLGIDIQLEHMVLINVEITESYKEESVFNLSFEFWGEFNEQGKGENGAVGKSRVL